MHLPLALTFFVSLASSLPQATHPQPHSIALHPRDPAPAPALTAAQLEAIAPTTKTCPANLPQCRNSTVAAPLIAASFAKYTITHPSVQAALVSLMLYESENFHYYTPESPQPGKGTFNMQSAAFNAKYAASLGMSTDQLLSGKEDGACFGSAAWFVTSQCGMPVREAMWGGKVDGWEKYISGCVGTTVNGQRQALFESALKVLGSD